MEQQPPLKTSIYAGMPAHRTLLVDLQMVHDIRLAIAVASALSWCRGARAFLPSSLQHRPHQQQLPLLQQRHPTAASRRDNVTAVRPLAFNLAWSLRNSLPWGPNKDQTSTGSAPGTQSSGMSNTGDDRHWGACKRNRDFITAEMKNWLTDEMGQVLEIASGTGCHVEAFAKELPRWTFQPTEHDEARFPDIRATIAEGGYTNITPPLALDVSSDPATWPRPQAEGGSTTLWDAAICTNMIHIAPPECTPGLLKGAAAGLKMGGRLFIYGPFALDGVLVPDSNKAFDESLKARSDGLWGIKDAAVVADLADEEGLELTTMTAMPANNFFVVFTKVREAGDHVAGDARASRVAARVSAVVKPAREALLASLAASEGAS